MDPAHASPLTGSRAPIGTLLREFVGEHYIDYFSPVPGEPVWGFIIKHFDRFMRCGDVRADYAVLQCGSCAALRKVALRCKSRVWCPPCMKLRQMSRARFFHQRVIGDTPVRHLALTLPHPLRVYAAYDPSLVTDILTIHIDENFRRLRWAAKRKLGLESVNEAKPASATFIQRWSSILDINLHFHTAMTDGVFFRPLGESPAQFVPLDRPSDSEIDDVAWQICRRTRDLLVRRGVWEDTPDEARDIVVPGSSGPRVLRTVAGVLTLDKKRRQRCRFFGTVSQHDSDEPISRDGAQAFNLFARDRVERGDGKNLRRLLRYMLSPPFTNEQLHRADDGGIVLDLKRERIDGTDTKHFPGDSFMEKLVQLVPRPNANLIRLHGAWGSNSAMREFAVPPPDEPEESPQNPDEETPEDYQAWGRVQSHIFGDDLRPCDHCGGRMKLIELRVGKFRYRRRSGIPPDESRALPEAPNHSIAA